MKRSSASRKIVNSFNIEFKVVAKFFDFSLVAF